MQVLADGRYLAELKPPRKKDGPPVTVRVIEYTVHTTAGDGGEQASEVFCLVTDLLDVEEYPALDLACAYPLRPPEQADLAFAAFLAKVLMPALFTRDRPGRASPRKTKKAGDFPARKPGEPSVTRVTRTIEFHLLFPWQPT